MRHRERQAIVRAQLFARAKVRGSGVRFVQLYHTNWDSHGGPGENLQSDFEKVCRDVDQGQAALIKDLKARGLLKDTLVIWGGEFGRTPMGENRDTTGRNHHIDVHDVARRRGREGRRDYRQDRRAGFQSC